MSEGVTSLKMPAAAAVGRLTGGEAGRITVRRAA